MRTRRGFLISAAALAAACSSETADEQEPDSQARTAWYRDARFGLFVHWGPYSVAGVEASWPIMRPSWFPHVKPISQSEYVSLPSKFNPVEYDPQSWVRTARDAGMRYIVFTTKHHDGFCMFDAPGTDYKITNTPYKQDIVAQLADACHREQMPVGFYYSPPDMHHPGFRDTSKPATENWNGEPSRPEWAGYLDYMESHLRKLLTDYGEVAIIWFDGLFGQDKYDPPRFHQLIHELSPDTLVNDRLGPGGDYVTPEQFFPRGIPVKREGPPPEIDPEMLDAWFEMSQSMPPENAAELAQKFSEERYPTKPLPEPDEFQIWETCMTMNNTWGYNPDDNDYKPPEQLIRTLVEVASRGGNFLLNVGPTPQGAFPPESVERLRRVGAWMERNGKSIYGTTYGPIQGLDFARSTAQDDIVYLHVLDWPGQKLEVDPVPADVGSVTRVASGDSVSFEQSGARLTISVPAEAPDPPVTVLAMRSDTA